MDVKIYYGDGSVFSGDSLDIEKPVDVQVIRCRDPHTGGFQLIHGRNWYLFKEGRWIGVPELSDVIDHIMYSTEVRKLLKGRMIDGQVFSDILHRANRGDD